MCSSSLLRGRKLQLRLHRPNNELCHKFPELNIYLCTSIHRRSDRFLSNLSISSLEGDKLDLKHIFLTSSAHYWLICGFHRNSNRFLIDNVICIRAALKRRGLGLARSGRHDYVCDILIFVNVYSGADAVTPADPGPPGAE